MAGSSSPAVMTAYCVFGMAPMRKSWRPLLHPEPSSIVEFRFANDSSNWSLLKLQLPGIALQAGRHRERRVELGPARAHPSATGTGRQQRSVEIRNDHVIAGLPRLGKNAAVGIENHRVAGADFVVIHPDAVAENEEESVVVRAARQPAHQP